VALTLAQFRAALPEFKNVGDGVVQAALDEAYQRTGDSWGNLRDAGAKWLAADLITSSPLGEPSAKGKAANGDTVYMRKWKELLAQVRGGFFAASIGMPVGGPEVGD
jgi:hypothetical protein